MLRNSVRVVIVAGLVVVGWAVGHAQSVAPQASTPAQATAPGQLPTRVLSDFELVVSTSDGTTKVTGVRGCRVSWAPASIPATGDIYVLDQTAVSGSLNSSGCVASDRQPQNCKIWGWKR